VRVGPCDQPAASTERLALSSAPHGTCSTCSRYTCTALCPLPSALCSQLSTLCCLRFALSDVCSLLSTVCSLLSDLCSLRSALCPLLSATEPCVRLIVVPNAGAGFREPNHRAGRTPDSPGDITGTLARDSLAPSLASLLPALCLLASLASADLTTVIKVTTNPDSVCTGGVRGVRPHFGFATPGIVVLFV
jgi:hypothetical protein